MLVLERVDLKSDCKEVPIKDLHFDMFTEDAQAAIIHFEGLTFVEDRNGLTIEIELPEEELQDKKAADQATKNGGPKPGDLDYYRGDFGNLGLSLRRTSNLATAKN